MQFILKVFTLLVVSIFYAQCFDQNTTVTVATLLEAPYAMLRNDTTLTGNERFEGYIIDLIDQLAKRFGFLYDVHIVQGGRYGSSHSGESKWDGIVGEVRSGRAILGTAPIAMTSEREKAVDFIPFMNLGISILYRRSSDGKALRFSNAEELAASETTKFGCVMDGATFHFFAQSDNPIYKRIYERMVSAEPSTLVGSVSEGIERVKSEDYAFFMESPSLEYAMLQDCDVQQVGGLVDSIGFGLVIRKDSPIRRHISNAILLLQEDGILVKLKEKWWTKENGEKCDH